MTYQLVVLTPFLTYQEGDTITDAGTIATILSGPYSVYVVKSAISS
jgi:hypothetical protein